MATEGSFQTIFVGDLSYFASEADLLTLFSQYGTVNSVKLQRGLNGENLQYAFVEILRESAEKAVNELQGQRFCGRKLRLSSSLPEEPREKRRARHDFIQVHVSFLTQKTDVTINEEYLERNFQVYGEIEDVTVKQHSMTRSPPKQSGYGFVYFINVDSALRAIETLKGVELEGVLFDCSLSHQSETELRRRSLLPHNLAAYKSPMQSRRSRQQGSDQASRNCHGRNNNNSNHRNNGRNHYQGQQQSNNGMMHQAQTQQEQWNNGYQEQEYMSPNAMQMYPSPAMAAAYMYGWQQQQMQLQQQMSDYQQQVSDYHQQMYAYQQQQQQAQQVSAAPPQVFQMPYTPSPSSPADAMQNQTHSQISTSAQTAVSSSPNGGAPVNLPMPVLLPPYPISVLTAEMAGMTVNGYNSAYAASGYTTQQQTPSPMAAVEYVHSASTDSYNSYQGRGSHARSPSNQHAYASNAVSANGGVGYKKPSYARKGIDNVRDRSSDSLSSSEERDHRRHSPVAGEKTVTSA